jgi:hypothetical protein
MGWLIFALTSKLLLNMVGYMFVDQPTLIHSTSATLFGLPPVQPGPGYRSTSQCVNAPDNVACCTAKL